MYFHIRSYNMGYEKFVLNIDDVCLVGKVKAVVKKNKILLTRKKMCRQSTTNIQKGKA